MSAESSAFTGFKSQKLDFLRNVALQDDNGDVIEYRRELVSNDLSERLFKICAKLLASSQQYMMPELVSSRQEITNAPLCFAQSVLKFISLDADVAVQVDKV